MAVVVLNLNGVATVVDDDYATALANAALDRVEAAMAREELYGLSQRDREDVHADYAAAADLVGQLEDKGEGKLYYDDSRPYVVSRERFYPPTEDEVSRRRENLPDDEARRARRERLAQAIADLHREIEELAGDADADAEPDAGDSQDVAAPEDVVAEHGEAAETSEPDVAEESGPVNLKLLGGDQWRVSGHGPALTFASLWAAEREVKRRNPLARV